jgi:hypothetical protein
MRKGPLEPRSDSSVPVLIVTYFAGKGSFAAPGIKEEGKIYKNYERNLS